jgi:hypothetical protein
MGESSKGSHLERETDELAAARDQREAVSL